MFSYGQVLRKLCTCMLRLLRNKSTCIYQSKNVIWQFYISTIMNNPFASSNVGLHTNDLKKMYYVHDILQKRFFFTLDPKNSQDGPEPRIEKLRTLWGLYSQYRLWSSGHSQSARQILSAVETAVRAVHCTGASRFNF
jgi:hypothetical protein